MDDTDTNTDTDRLIVRWLSTRAGPKQSAGASRSTSNTLAELTVQGVHGAPWEKGDGTYI